LNEYVERAFIDTIAVARHGQQRGMGLLEPVSFDSKWDESIPVSMNIGIRLTNGRTLQRRLSFHDWEREYFREARMLDPVHAEKMTRLPEVDAETSLWLFGGNLTPEIGYDNIDVEALWNLFVTEYNQLTVEQQLFHNGSIHQNPDGYDSIITIAFSGYLDNVVFQSNYRITPLTPRTYDKFLNEIFEAQADEAQRLVEIVLREDQSAIEEANFRIELTRVAPDWGGVILHYCMNDCGHISQVDFATLQEISAIIQEESLPNGESRLDGLYSFTINGREEGRAELYINISPRILEKLGEVL